MNLEDKINQLKKEKKAIILSHFYQRDEVQRIGDFLGDSLNLCKKAASVEDKDIIVFNGVDFMAETASIVNPSKVVLQPIKDATCPMAHMLKAKEIKKYKKKYPHAKVVLYVNSLAEAKAEADVMCTSANAKDVVSNLDCNQILFGPDSNLCDFVKKNCPDKEIIPMPKDGHCYVHKCYTIDDINYWRHKKPDAKILVHPECKIEIQEASDGVLSTSQMIKYVNSSEADEFIIGTEIGLLRYMQREFPNNEYYPLLLDSICSNMKKTYLDDVYNALEKNQYVVKVDEKLAKPARDAIEKMFELTK